MRPFRGELINISENHKKIIGISLRQAEKHLRKIKLALTHANKKEPTIMYVEKDNVDASVKSKALALVDEMLEEIKSIKREFGLDIETDYANKEIAVSLSEIWVLLEELRASKLKAYGQLSQAEKSLTEPRVIRLLGLHSELEAVLK